MKKRALSFSKSTLQLHLMVLPALTLLLIYSYGPMLGLVMAFQDFNPMSGWFRSPWVGLANFQYVFMLPNFLKVIWNTLFISVMEIIIGQSFAILLTLLLNEIGNKYVRGSMQTIIYLPHFLSWVILGGILMEVLSYNYGIVNTLLKDMGLAPVMFLGDSKIFPWTLIFSHVCKEAGFATVVLFASLSGINPNLYEAAKIDGAGRFRLAWHITLPGMATIIVLVCVLSVGNLLNAGFEQVFTLYSPMVYDTGDIIDTFVYRVGLVQVRYSLATAVGLFKSVVSLTLVSLSYYMAYRFANYRIF